MADTPDTPKPPAKPPTTTRRRASRPSAGMKPVKAPPAKPKPVPEATTPSPSTPPPKRPPAPKPRSTKRAPAPKRHAPAPIVAETPAEPAKTGGKWAKAATVGGLAAIGAIATAALLSLRGSTPKVFEAVSEPTGGAHTANGTDASDSFAAGIADENSIPDKL